MKSETSEVKSKAMTGIFWKMSEKVGMQLINFMIQIVLARLLLPEDYGIVGLLTIFISISDVFLLQGFTTALIQKKDADEVDFSSVFIANVMMAFVIYGILFLLSPFVAEFYHEPRLSAIMKVLSLNVIVGSFSSVHNSIMSKNLEFKKSFWRTTANTLAHGISGIWFAYMGMGVWALVYSKLVGTLVGTIVICGTVKWRPKRIFSLERLKKLFSYSSKILMTNLINVVFNNIHSLIIGRYYAKSDLGFYQRGQQFPTVLSTAVDGSLSEVIYPTLSKLQDNLEQVKIALRRAMKTSMFLMLPLLMGLIAVAEEMIVVLLTEKWLPCVPYMRLACIICAFWPLSARTQALNALGKSNITFKLSMIAKALTLIMIFICVPFGIYAILLGTIFSSCITVWFTSYYVNKYIHYTLKEFILDLLPSILISLVMLAVVMMVGLWEVNVYAKLCVQVMVGVFTYAGLSAIFKVDSFYYILNILKSLVKK